MAGRESTKWSLKLLSLPILPQLNMKTLLSITFINLKCASLLPFAVFQFPLVG